MPFSYLDRTPARNDGAERRAQVAATELASRAAMFYRLGFTEADATARLIARADWEHEGGRPASLSDQAIAKIVADTYARRPG